MKIKELISELKKEYIETKGLTCFIDEDLHEALMKLTSNNKIPVSYILDMFLRIGLDESIKEKKILKEMKKYKKNKLNTTIKKDVLVVVNNLCKLFTSPKSYIVNYLLRLGFEKKLKDMEDTKKNSLK